MSIAVEIIQEEPAIDRPAKVIIRFEDKILYEIVANIIKKEGADGGQYNCVALTVLP